MFLEKTYEKNKKLIEFAVKAHQAGEILPDSYVIDLDSLLENARIMLAKAREKNVTLYFMLKQLGRNPYIAKKLVEIGYQGAVVVDFKEAQVMMDNNIPIGHIGNLVQIPEAMIERVLRYGVSYISVFSLEKLKTIDRLAGKNNIIQKVILRVYSNEDVLYPSQEAGINIDELESFLEDAKSFENIKISGATSFPAYLYDSDKNDIVELENYKTIRKAIDLIQKNGYEIEHINTPSSTCTYVIDKYFNDDNLVGEPGHGLTGTTPLHAKNDLVEKPCLIYLSEVSHNFKDMAYVYGGGYYRRSHVKNALVSFEDELAFDEVLQMSAESIDYYFRLKNSHKIGACVVMAFRFQVFVTRSNLVIVEDLGKDPKITGIYDSQGRRLYE